MEEDVWDDPEQFVVETILDKRIRNGHSIGSILYQMAWILVFRAFDIQVLGYQLAE